MEQRLNLSRNRTCTQAESATQREKLLLAEISISRKVIHALKKENNILKKENQRYWRMLKKILLGSAA
jgi:hypothetical protein